MKLIPILTEKSLADAKEGKYSFWVDVNATKFKIKQLVKEVFAVEVVKIRTANFKGESKKTYTGRKKSIKPRKKAIVTLRGKGKIDVFDESKK
ncbi:50S ribosomal protein L23 [Candidatus Woesebacteria bacterium]|nr:MAG: 50S ribosomal protein L23 [Candidatus Woesebacteria bacterium]